MVVWGWWRWGKLFYMARNGCSSGILCSSSSDILSVTRLRKGGAGAEMFILELAKVLQEWKALWELARFVFDGCQTGK